LITVDCHNPAYYDVDDTLIMRTGQVPGAMEMKTERGSIWVKPHQPHCDIIKELHAQGITIIVWSAGGSDHAARAVKLLGLEQYVDVCLEKPHWVIDDKPVDNWMPKAGYKPPQKDVQPVQNEKTTNGGASFEPLNPEQVTRDPKTFEPLHPVIKK
jgi:hypothetical protein